MFYAIKGVLGSSSLECDYNMGWDFWVVGIKYRCYVSNNLNISSPESAKIVAVNGTHMSGKSNNDEIYFHASNKHITYLPRGLERFFTNLTGIAIYGSQIKEIHQDDLKPYTKLIYFGIGRSNIEVIEDGLFDYQPNIKVIDFYQSEIFHISSTVFDNLLKLTSMDLKGNNCTNQESKNNRANTLEVIKSVKFTCNSSGFLKLDKKLKNLEIGYKNINRENFYIFIKDFENFKDELKASKFSKFTALKNRVIEISDLKMSFLWDKFKKLNKFQSTQNAQVMSINNKISNIENMLSEMNNRSTIRNLWMILVTSVVGFTQVIILAVLYKQFIA